VALHFGNQTKRGEAFRSILTYLLTPQTFFNHDGGETSSTTGIKTKIIATFYISSVFPFYILPWILFILPWNLILPQILFILPWVFYFCVFFFYLPRILFILPWVFILPQILFILPWQLWATVDFWQLAVQ